MRSIIYETDNGNLDIYVLSNDLGRLKEIKQRPTEIRTTPWSCLSNSMLVTAENIG